MRFSFSPRQTDLPVDMISLRVNNNLTCATTENNNTHAWVDIDFKSCNTSMEITSQHINRNTVVEVWDAEPNSLITRSKMGLVVKYSVSCQYYRTQNVSPDHRSNATGFAAKVVETRQVSSLADFNLTMDFYQDATLTTRLMSPTVDIGEPMYLAVTNQNPEGLKILVDTCFASASSDPSDKSLHYMFFNDGCSYDATFENLTSSDDFHKFGFRIDAFVFIKRQSQVRK